MGNQTQAMEPNECNVDVRSALGYAISNHEWKRKKIIPQSRRELIPPFTLTYQRDKPKKRNQITINENNTTHFIFSSKIKY